MPYFLEIDESVDLTSVTIFSGCFSIRLLRSDGKWSKIVIKSKVIHANTNSVRPTDHACAQPYFTRSISSHGQLFRPCWLCACMMCWPRRVGVGVCHLTFIVVASKIISARRYCCRDYFCRFSSQINYFRIYLLEN